MGNACKSTVVVNGNAAFAEDTQALLDAVFSPHPQGGRSAVSTDGTAAKPVPIASMCIETPLLPPIPLIAELSATLPELGFQLRYDIPAIRLRGQMDYANGVVQFESREADGEPVVRCRGGDGAIEKGVAGAVGTPAFQWIHQQADLHGLRSADVEDLRRSRANLPNLRAVAEELLACGYSYIYDGASGVVAMGRRDGDAMYGYLNACERVTTLLRPEDKQAMKELGARHEAAVATLSRRATACMEMLDALTHFEHPDVIELLDARDHAALKGVKSVIMKVRPEYWAALEIPAAPSC